MHKWHPDERTEDATEEIPARDRGRVPGRAGFGWLDVGRRTAGRFAARTVTLPPEITMADALAASMERIQSVLCSFSLSDRERNNAVASVAHHALLDYGGGYTVEARARRERHYKALAQTRTASPPATETD